MAAQPGGQRDRPFQVHRIAGRQAGQAGPPDRLLRQVEPEVAGTAVDDGQADAVHRKARADVASLADGARRDPFGDSRRISATMGSIFDTGLVSNEGKSYNVEEIRHDHPRA